MKQQSLWAALLCAGLLTLTACGGSSSGSSEGGDGASNGGGSGGGGTGPNPNPNPAPTAYLCESHTASQVNVVGNNTYEFIAANGACFGTRDDFSLAKREVPLTPDFSMENAALLSVSPMGRLATKEAGPATTFKTLYLAFDVTNISASTICVDFGAGTDGAVFRGGNAVIGAFGLGLEVLGDMFFAQTDYRNNCIPSGETRTVWGSGTRDLSEDQINAIDTIAIRDPDVEFDFVDASIFQPRFLPALTPGEAVWTSAVETVFGDEQYRYEITNTFVNDTADRIDFRSDNVQILYFDDAGYLLYDSLATVSGFLGIDDAQLTQSDLEVPPSGGMIGIADEFRPIVPAFGATQHILGRASKMVVHLDVCSPDLCSFSN